MSNILVTGANGFLGAHVVERLLARGHNVTALMRPAARAPEWADRVRLFRIDLRAPQGLDEALTGIDTVVHVAAATSGSEDMQFASTVGGTEKLLAAMKTAGTRKLVLVSSFVVYDFRKVGRVLSEDSPLDKDIYDMGGYSIAKAWQERVVNAFAAETGTTTVALRPGFIWGRDHAEFVGMGRRVGPVHLVFSPQTHIPITYVANCADAIVAATDADLPSGSVFNVVDGQRVSAWRYAGDFLKRSHSRAWRVPVPYWTAALLARAASWWSKRSFGERGQLPSFLSRRKFEAQSKPVRVSMDRLTRQLQWTAPVSYAEALAETHAPAGPQRG